MRRYVGAWVAAGCALASCSASSPQTAATPLTSTAVSPTSATTTTAIAAARPIAARPSPGCARRTLGASPPTETFAAEGVDGSYIATTPPGAVARKPLPVIFDLHGYEEPGSVQVSMSALGPYGRTHGFVTITPWIDNRAVPHWLATVASTDMAWFGALLTHVEATRCVDERRVFVTGISNGAAMTSAIACRFSSRVAAVAPVAGIQTNAPCDATRPVPVVAFHGAADPVLHYDGTPSKGAAALEGLSGSGTLTAREAQRLGLAGALTR
ncbi:MAG TPA: PHB depolymerase family esterase, partial [Candidatus Elarobacter sp.]|nr:PHB depolymerase family esterase [Candidatus Elarobacter sp.]